MSDERIEAAFEEWFSARAAEHSDIHGVSVSDDIHEACRRAFIAGALRESVSPRPDGDLTFGELAVTNRKRCERWHPGFPYDDWTGADWSNAAAGEMGEACNVVKKLRRMDVGIAQAERLQSADDEAHRQMLTDKLADEIADTAIYLDLLAQHYGIALSDAIVRKFNAISDREGFPEKLRADAVGVSPPSPKPTFTMTFDTQEQMDEWIRETASARAAFDAAAPTPPNPEG